MKVQTVRIETIKPYPNNPRVNDQSVEDVANSIQAFGFQQPIVVDKNNIVIVGHTRLKAAQALGLNEVPVVVADNLTPDEVAAYRLADNKVSEKSFWDTAKLDIELKNIELDMSGFGFAEFEPVDLDALFVPDDSEPKDKEPEEIKCPHCGLYFTR